MRARTREKSPARDPHVKGERAGISSYHLGLIVDSIVDAPEPNCAGLVERMASVNTFWNPVNLVMKWSNRERSWAKRKGFAPLNR